MKLTNDQFLTVEQLMQTFQKEPCKKLWNNIYKIYNEIDLNNPYKIYIKIFLIAANIRQAYIVYNIKEHEQYINELEKLIVDENCKKYLKYALKSPN